MNGKGKTQVTVTFTHKVLRKGDCHLANSNTRAFPDSYANKCKAEVRADNPKLRKEFTISLLSFSEGIVTIK